VVARLAGAERYIARRNCTFAAARTFSFLKPNSSFNTFRSCSCRVRFGQLRISGRPSGSSRNHQGTLLNSPQRKAYCPPS